jgi:hypothetical protein
VVTRFAARSTIRVRALRTCELDPRVSHAGRGFDRGSGTIRCAVILLALGLSLNGIALCLCTSGPTMARDSHACCPRTPGDVAVTATTSATVIASSCCASQAEARFAAGAESRVFRTGALTYTSVTHTVPDARIAAFTVGAPSFSLRNTPLSLRPVLRI